MIEHVVEVAPWQLELINQDEFLGTAAQSTPYHHAGLAPSLASNPKLAHLVRGSQQWNEALGGLYNCLSHAMNPADRGELQLALGHLGWKYSDLQAFLATTQKLRLYHNEFVNLKRARRTWKQGRQVLLRGTLPKEPSIDEQHVWEFKGHEVDVMRVEEDRKCVVRLTKEAGLREYTLSTSMLFDYEYVISIPKSRSANKCF